jgi:hypothetical protein
MGPQTAESIYLAQNRVLKRHFANAVVNFRVLCEAGGFLIDTRPLSQEESFYQELLKSFGSMCVKSDSKCRVPCPQFLDTRNNLTISLDERVRGDVLACSFSTQRLTEFRLLYGHERSYTSQEDEQQTQWYSILLRLSNM